MRKTKIGGIKMSTYELSLTSNYVADWDFKMAIRELIQNGVDQETLEPGNVFNIFYENGTLQFENLKSKLKINTLLLGRSSKTHDDNTVGQFGEGYKISALVLNRLGKTFTVHNYGKNEIWTTRFINSRKWHDKILAFDVNENISSRNGLVIEVGNITPEEYDAIQDIWLGFKGDYKKIDTSKGEILLDESEKNKIYVNGLYISCSADLQYGYNFHSKYLKLERDRKSCDSFDAKLLTSEMLNEAFLEDKIEPGKIMEMVEDENDDVMFLKYTSNRSKVIQACMDTIDKQGKEMISMQKENEELPEELTQAIPVSEPSEYDRIKNQGGNPVFIKPHVYELVKYVAEERTDNLYNYRKEVPVKERTLKEEFEFWMELYGKELSYKAESTLKELIEQI